MGRLDAQAAYAYWNATEEGFANMGGYDENGYDFPYTEEQVFDVETRADEVARMMVGPGAPKQFRDIGEVTLSNLIYDAMVALRERVIAKEGF